MCIKQNIHYILLLINLHNVDEPEVLHYPLATVHCAWTSPCSGLQEKSPGSAGRRFAPGSSRLD